MKLHVDPSRSNYNMIELYVLFVPLHLQSSESYFIVHYMAPVRVTIFVHAMEKNGLYPKLSHMFSAARSHICLSYMSFVHFVSPILTLYEDIECANNVTKIQMQSASYHI